MADETTPRLNLVKPEVGGSADTWGDKWNENADKIDAAIIRLDEENVWSAPQRFDGPLRVGPETGAGVELRGDGSLDAEGGLYEGGQRVVTTSRSISTGTGLTGGGNLSANRTISIASSHIPIGVGQTWQLMSPERVVGVTYTNTTGRPIFVAAQVDAGSGEGHLLLYVDNVSVSNFMVRDVYHVFTVSALVPPGSTYRINKSTSGKDINWWRELR